MPSRRKQNDKKNFDAGADIARQMEKAKLFTNCIEDTADEDELLDKLNEACRLYVLGGAASRAGMRLALHWSIAYFRSELPEPNGILDRLLLPLERLEDALFALDEGVVHTPLAPEKRKGGSKLTKDEAGFRLMVCVAAELLTASGIEMLEARKVIAN